MQDWKIPKAPGGPYRAETAAYVTVHARLRYDRGRAATHQCVDCDRQAAHWSYDHADPDELIDKGLAYSLKSEHYAPRCNRCHAAFDELGVKAAFRGHGSCANSCVAGHLRTPESVYRSPSGATRCRICNRASAAAYKARKREQVSA